MQENEAVHGRMVDGMLRIAHSGAQWRELLEVYDPSAYVPELVFRSEIYFSRSLMTYL